MRPHEWVEVFVLIPTAMREIPDCNPCIIDCRVKDLQLSAHVKVFMMKMWDVTPAYHFNVIFIRIFG